MLKHGTCPVTSSLSVSCIAAKFKSTSSSLSCVFDLSPLPVLYCLWCAETLRRRFGLHELRYVAVLLSAVTSGSRNAVLAATAVPQHNTATPLMCFGSYCLPVLSIRTGKTVWIAKAAICRCVSLCTPQYHSARSASCTLSKT